MKPAGLPPAPFITSCSTKTPILPTPQPSPQPSSTQQSTTSSMGFRSQHAPLVRLSQYSLAQCAAERTRTPIRRMPKAVIPRLNLYWVRAAQPMKPTQPKQDVLRLPVVPQRSNSQNLSAHKKPFVRRSTQDLFGYHARLSPVSYSPLHTGFDNVKFRNWNRNQVTRV